MQDFRRVDTAKQADLPLPADRACDTARRVERFSIRLTPSVSLPRLDRAIHPGSMVSRAISKFESYAVSFRGALLREPGIHNHWPGLWIPGSPPCGGAPE